MKSYTGKSNLYNNSNNYYIFLIRLSRLFFFSLDYLATLAFFPSVTRVCTIQIKFKHGGRRIFPHSNVDAGAPAQLLTTCTHTWGLISIVAAQVLYNASIWKWATPEEPPAGTNSAARGF